MDHFVKIDGVDGESRHSKHKGEIDVLSWSWGLSTGAATPASGRGATKARPNDLTFTHLYDVASPSLLRLAASGKFAKTATLVARRAGTKDSVEFLKITMKDVRVTSIADDASGDAVAEAVTLRPKHIEFQYRSQNPDGSAGTPVTVAWDIANNSVT